MDFALTEEQQMIVKTTRDFVRNELLPHEKEVEETGVLRPELQRQLKAKAIDAGLYAANMPAEVGGAGLDTVTWVLYEKELGHANYALHYSCVGRPSNILLACAGETHTNEGNKGDANQILQAGSGKLHKGKTTFVLEGYLSSLSSFQYNVNVNAATHDASARFREFRTLQLLDSIDSFPE